MSDEIGVRPRARTVTPVRVLLLAVVLLAAGFAGGVEVQKRAGRSSGSGGNGAAGFARFAGAGAARGGSGGTAFGSGAANATVGQVANVHGKTLYVTGSGGTTVKVRTTAQTKVTRTAVSRVHAVHPGDTVIVQGATSSSGTVKASRVTATASNASSFGGFGGATPSGG